MARTSLRRKTVATALLCFVAFLALQTTVIIAYNNHRQEEAQASLNAILATKCDALDQLDANLRVIGTYLSLHAGLADMFAANLQPRVENDMMDTVFDLARLTIQASDVIDDVLFINMSGVGRSYASGVGASLIDLVRTQYSYSDPALRTPRYFFFPNYPFVHDAQFAYVVPILRVNMEQPEPEKVGTIIFACESDALGRLLQLEVDQSYAVTVSDARGVVLERRSDAYAPKARHVEASRTLSGLSLTLRVVLAPLSLPMRDFYLQTTLAGAALFLITLLLNLRVMRRFVLRPINGMVSEMIRVQRPQNEERLTKTSIQELDTIVEGANAMIGALAESADERLRAQAALMEAHIRQREMELYALQSQINPHFLFNTMQCIRALGVSHGISDVADIATAMARVLRYAIQSGDTVRIADEAEVIRQYLRITDIRYQRRVRHTIGIPDEILRMTCIKMVIQPLVENAVIHGLAPRPGEGTVTLRAWRAGDDAVIEVHDDGQGFSAGQLEEIRALLAMDFREAILRDGTRSFGLYNISRRMKLAYGEQYGLEL